MVTRRQFAFWCSFGLFALAEKLRVYGLDELAASTISFATDSATPSPTFPLSAPPIHWRAADNEAWEWYERETLINGRWTLSGITTPLNKATGARHPGQGYLDVSQVPENMRRGYVEIKNKNENKGRAAQNAHHERTASPTRRARHGRPPSKWLRSLNADELRIWLKTIDVPEAGVEGMTYWEHLTRDHSFAPEKIEGLALDDQAKLHAAAHFGY